MVDSIFCHSSEMISACFPGKSLKITDCFFSFSWATKLGYFQSGLSETVIYKEFRRKQVNLTKWLFSKVIYKVVVLSA